MIVEDVCVIPQLMWLQLGFLFENRGKSTTRLIPDDYRINLVVQKVKVELYISEVILNILYVAK